MPRGKFSQTIAQLGRSKKHRMTNETDTQTNRKDWNTYGQREIFVFVCGCGCAWLYVYIKREKERERERERESERKKVIPINVLA